MQFSALIYSAFISSSLVRAAPSVGIVGAGASGLYAAILLQSLGIEYEILEASDRSGGRIWTHYFDPEAWKVSKPGKPEYYDYFDVGAMRIPRSPFMERLIGNQPFSLVPYINRHVKSSDKLVSVPFIFSNNDTFLYYNHNLRKSSDSLVDDPFKTGLPNFTELDPRSMWDSIIHNFVSTLSTNFAQGFAQLSRYRQSVRQYLSTRNLSFLEISWLETFLEGTGHFDVDLTEIVLEDWLFGTDSDYAWTTIEGGMSRLVNGMEGLLAKAVLYSQRVTAISQNDASPSITVTTSEGTTRNYDHVINTAPLGAMQAMDMSTLQMGYTKESAIRMINYDDSMKIGIKFKSRWWQESLPTPIFGGQSTSDLPIRTCVYPSYGVNTSDAAAVMIASYTWGQDASRLASYLSTPASTVHLINLTISSLAILNNVSASFLQEQYVSHFAYSWYSSEFSIGAFPEFAPGQFAQLMPELMTPVGKGNRVHLGGDALSAGHAWIVGALNAAYRCVREVLEAEGEGGEVKRLEEMWGPLIDIRPGNDTYSTSLVGMQNISRIKRAKGRRLS